MSEKIQIYWEPIQHEGCFKTSHTLRHSLVKSKPDRNLVDTRHCVHSMPIVYPVNAAGATLRKRMDHWGCSSQNTNTVSNKSRHNVPTMKDLPSFGKRPQFYKLNQTLFRTVSPYVNLAWEWHQHGHLPSPSMSASCRAFWPNLAYQR
jgi:hypothetical protein